MDETRNDGPIVGITMGDAAGIGPEIVLKALTDPNLKAASRCIVIGDAAALRAVAAGLKLDVTIGVPGDATDDSSIKVVDLANLPREFQIGVDAEITGRAAAQNIEASVDLWRDGMVSAICTAPISKNAIKLGGYDQPGHTEFLAELTATKDFRMSFFAGDLRVVLLSTHRSLLSAIEFITKNSLVELIKFTDREMSRLLGREVSIAVAGLNPHASENGLFGNEEALYIMPAINECVAAGINVTGPYSPDTIFIRGHKGEFDAVIALYHDQATIAVKSISFGAGVNVTLGLPVIRTSVDHGTAYDIAGKGVADHSSMMAAIDLAYDLALGRLAGGASVKMV